VSGLPRGAAGRLLGSVGGAAALVATLAVATSANADPQGHVALRAAPCGVGSDGKLWQQTHFCAGLTGDLLFLRHRNRDLGLGPYFEVNTAGFWDARFGGGLSLLLPVMESYPLVLSLGAFDHELRAASLGGTVFWGARSYNFDSAYNYALGVYASAYRDLDSERATLISVGVEVDGFFVLAPFLFAFQALR
jgi:hypothetical protein